MSSKCKSVGQQRTEQFMLLAGQQVPLAPTIPSEDVRRLRAKLIWEECLETIRGLGFEPRVLDASQAHLADSDKEWASVDEQAEVKFIAVCEPDLVEIADGCADIIVVTTGTLSACGIADEAIQREVDESNLRKFGPGSRRREDGKWEKPDSWTPPDIAGRLREQGWNGPNGSESTNC